MKKVSRLRNPEELANNSERVGVRTTGRIKKAKVVFDPSDNYLPRYQRSVGSVNSSQHHSDVPSDSSNERRIKEEKPNVPTTETLDGNSCYVCMRRELKKNKSKLISCKDCDNKVHITCLQREFEDINKLRENYRCNTCQVCSSCYEGHEDGPLITCTKCVKSFHYSCHIPSMARFASQTKWHCSKCTIPKVKAQTKTAESSKATSSNIDSKADRPNEVPPSQPVRDGGVIEKKSGASPVTNGKVLRLTPNDLCEIPIVKNWSVDEVVEFFMKFFPNEAHIFKKHDIDGQSLLLMKRSDVVKKMDIKLGPALRIYNLILKIQSQSADPTIGW